MKTSIIVDAKDLAQALREIKPAVGVKSTLPVLSQVLLTAEGEQVRLTANDLQNALELMIPGAGEGSLLADYRSLLKSVEGQMGPVTVQPMQKKNKADNDTTEVLLDGYRVGVRSFPTEEFPAVPNLGVVAPLPDRPEGAALPPDRPWHSVSADAPTRIAQVLPAVSHDPGRRPEIQGVCLNSKHLIATDQYRVHVAPAIASGLGEKESVIIHGDSAALLAGLMKKRENWKVRYSDSLVEFLNGTARLVAKRIEGNYPNYERVIPTATDQSIKVNRKALLALLAKSMPFSALEGWRTHLLAQRGKLSLSTLESECTFSASLSCEVTGKPLDIFLSASLLSDALKAIDAERVKIRHESGKDDWAKPVLIEHKGFRAVVMPMQGDKK